ncbi:hypothetical protein NitoCp007 (chloroplast) [Nicotiana tomentosiformis]|uniref:Uncharacterized protein n=1 Tax=Nicotiana tomentosiformis TaxID=4098 RepID=Q33C54_NICTO|nr:hypothetical protein NitoCp007 [Nicotiana tomentosiformis]BAE47981.1 hypothetical protein [Nicotiana tomentosiformis]
MIPDVILDVKNKIKRGFPCLIFKFSYDLVYSTHLTKNKNKGFRNLKKKNQVINGKRGIRTLGTINSYNGLAIRRFSPLSHLSQLKKIITT